MCVHAVYRMLFRTTTTPTFFSFLLRTLLLLLLLCPRTNAPTWLPMRCFVIIFYSDTVIILILSLPVRKPRSISSTDVNLLHRKVSILFFFFYLFFLYVCAIDHEDCVDGSWHVHPQSDAAQTVFSIFLKCFFPPCKNWDGLKLWMRFWVAEYRWQWRNRWAWRFRSHVSVPRTAEVDR